MVVSVKVRETPVMREATIVCQPSIPASAVEPLWMPISDDRAPAPPAEAIEVPFGVPPCSVVHALVAVPVSNSVQAVPELSVVAKACSGGDCSRVMVPVPPLEEVDVHTALKVAFLAALIVPPKARSWLELPPDADLSVVDPRHPRTPCCRTRPVCGVGPCT